MRLFDTTFIVDLVNSDSGAARLASKVDQEGSFAAISAVSVHEYLFGVYFRYRSDGDRLKGKLASAENDLRRFEVLPFTKEVAEVSSNLHADLVKGGRQLGINDVYIAATAIRYNLTLLTRDKAHFERISKLRVETY